MSTPIAVPAPTRVTRRFGAAVAIFVIAFAALLVVIGQHGRHGRSIPRDTIRVLSGTTAATAPAGHYTQPTATPFDSAVLALRRHAGALTEGDEAGWLAAVNPGDTALVARYRAIYQALRAMGITRFEYTPGISTTDKKDPAAFTFPVRAYYCFGADTCADGDPPSIGQTLTMKDMAGKYVITAAADAKPDSEHAEPTPWQDGKLVIAQGQRVVVGADPSEAAYLSTVLPVAEQAAAADEKFAEMLLAKQAKYRIFLAGERQWDAWYGGEGVDWAVGYAVPISLSGYDVVIRVRELQAPTELRVTLQHELGHVITLTGSSTFRTRNQWLSEGVAEYIGWSPKRAKDSFRRPSVEWSLSRKSPLSMIPELPPMDAQDRAGDAFYGLSHYAVDCLAQKYGQANMFRFVRLVLLRDEDYETASSEAFHQPFTKVDKSCAAWIRHQA